MKKILAISLIAIGVFSTVASMSTSSATAVLKNGLSSTAQKIEALE